MELIQIVWNLIMLRDAQKKGQLKARVWVLAIAFLVILYGVALPMMLYYVKHPNYLPLMVAAIALVAISFIVVVWLGLKWYFEGARAAQASKEAAQRTD